MGNYERKDFYYHKAKEKGLPSRASFKIEEILGKFKLVRQGNTVIELGAAPGGWTVFLSQAVAGHGKVLALDLKPLKIHLKSNIYFLQDDIQSENAKIWLEDNIAGGKAHCICSDMSPDLSGIPFRDAYLSYELGLKVLEVAQKYLIAGGSMVCKIFPGEEFPEYLKILRKHFKKVQVFEPKSSRKTSREVYVLGMVYHSS